MDIKYPLFSGILNERQDYADYASGNGYGKDFFVDIMSRKTRSIATYAEESARVVRNYN